MSESDKESVPAGKEHGPETRRGQGWRRFMPRKRTLFFISVAAHVLGALASVHAVMSVRSATATIAWALALNMMPYVALPLYLVIGNDEFAGYVEARRIAEQEFSRSAEAVTEFLERVESTPSRKTQELDIIQSLTQVPELPGNIVEILEDGAQTFPSIFSGIGRAGEYVLAQFYIIRDDDTGREFRRTLRERAEAGVDVHLLYDEIGCQSLPDGWFEPLRKAGAKVSSFNSSQGGDTRFQINFRNHRKVVVVDGTEAWLGGLNVGDEYLGENPDFGDWRDTHLRIEGPAVLAAQLTYLEDWYWATGDVLDLRWEAHHPPEGNTPVHIVPSGPTDERRKAKLLYLQAITSARERLWIASPYFVPDASITSALELAVLRGVDVRILVSDAPGTRSAYYALFTYLEELNHTDIEFYMYEAGYVHEKVLLKDDDTAIIGTVNLDNRSLYLNFEISALIEDADFAARVERMLERDFARSRLLSDSAYTDKPLWFRFWSNVSRLAAPLL